MPDKRRITALCAAAFLTAGLFGCMSSSGGNVAYTATGVPENGYVSDHTLSDADGTYAAAAAEREALGSMTKKLENAKAALYLGPYADIAVEDKTTGTLWFSNPDNYGLRGVTFTSDEAEHNARSALTIDYYDNSYKATMATMSSYPDAVDGGDRFQITEKQENGALTVTYTLGTDYRQMVYYTAMTADTYAALTEKLEEKSESGEISFTLYGLFMRSYAEPDLNGTPYYALESGVTQLDLERLSGLFRTLGITSADVEAENARTGVKEEKRESACFVLPVEYRLDGADLLVSIPSGDIEVSDGYYLNRIHLFKTLGSAAQGTEGYLFVPNGSGMLIKNDTQSGDMHTLTMGFFGSDYGLSLTESKRLTAENALPVFGAVSEGKAVCAVVESGEGSAGLTACVSNASVNANAVWPYFEIRACDETAVGITATISTMRVFAQKPVRTTFRTRYHFLYGDRANYSGMAAFVRTYLTQTGVLTPQTTPDTLLTVEYLGSIRKKQLKFGLPVWSYVPLTTFDQAEEITEKLMESAVPAPDVLFSGMANGGISSTAFTRFSVRSELGGIEGFRRIASAMTGSRLYAGLTLTRISRSGGGFSLAGGCVRSVNQQYATLAEYDPSSGLKASEDYLCSPSEYTALAKAVAADAKQLGITRLYVQDIGDVLPADYNENRVIPRETARGQAMEALALLAADGRRLTVEGGASYVLPYAEKLVNVPLTAQSYRLQYRSVPFYQMVLHGSIAYTGPAINLEGNHRMALLKAAETGAGLYYKLMYADNAVLSNTDYTNLSSTSYSLWMNDIAEKTAELSDLFSRVGTSAMIKHRWLSDTLTLTVYENGTAVLVNYAKTQTDVGDLTVSPESFAVTERGSVEAFAAEGGSDL